ncbi:DNA-directed RNA polymerase II subunit RPB7 [Pseudohyphozyma bogoriensis]|nr:DNA-directed RNA polymerase II subunit RPB7 [Pseudohyphozyma bogoriensis]
MFFLTELERTLTLSPSYFTPTLKAYLHTLLYHTVEGTCSGQIGYIIAVMGVTEVGQGKIVGGQAEFNIKYSAIVYRPFKNEVVDGVVASVNKMGIFADVGPLTCFVSTHLIPPDFKFDPNANPPCFTSTEDTLKIEKGSKLRLKIVGTRVDATEIFAIGTIKEDYLGPLG